MPTNLNPRTADPSLALQELGLTQAEINALARQGFVSGEVRNGELLYKLRYRYEGRQRVRSLGHDAQRAAAIQSALQLHQQERRRALRDRRWKKHVFAQLKIFKARLSPWLSGLNQHFHGLFLRQRRIRKDSALRPPEVFH